MGMQTQVYFTDEESLKAHAAWAEYLKTINKDGSQVSLGQFITTVFFSVINDDVQFKKFLEKHKVPKPQKPQEK